jgi:urease accessory protein
VRTAAALQSNAEIFAGNRATGHVALGVAAHGGRTRRRVVHEDGSLRVRFPNTTQDGLEAVIVNTAGGMAGGDKFDIALAVGEGAHLMAGTAAAEKIYRSDGAATDVSLKIELEAGARLAWLPQETILFDQAQLARRIDIELANTASLLMVEGLVFGRAAMGEAMNGGLLADRWRLRVGGRLVFAENARLDGAIAAKLARSAVAAGGIAIATVLLAPANDDALAAVRAHDGLYAGEVGVSAWNGMAVARLCARDGAALRHDLISLLAALGTQVPRLWLN